MRLWQLFLALALPTAVSCQGPTAASLELAYTFNSIDVTEVRSSVGFYATFSPIRSVTAVVIKIGELEGCSSTNTSPAVENRIIVTPRGSCSFSQKGRYAERNNAKALIVVDHDDDSLVLMGPDSGAVPNVLAVSVPKNVGDRIDHLIDLAGNLTITISPTQPRDNEHEDDTVTVYSRTVVFVILCVVIVLIFSVYCQGSLRGFRADNATRFQQEQMRANLADRAKALVERMPVRDYVEGAEGEEDGPSNNCCAVCLDDFSAGDKIREIPCKHCFHVPCIDPWLIAHRTCPLCKYDILENHVEPAPGTEATADGAQHGNANEPTDGANADAVAADNSVVVEVVSAGSTRDSPRGSNASVERVSLTFERPGASAATAETSFSSPAAAPAEDEVAATAATVATVDTLDEQTAAASNQHPDATVLRIEG